MHEQEDDSDSHIAENAAAENLYDTKYRAIRDDFNKRVTDRIHSESTPETFKY